MAGEQKYTDFEARHSGQLIAAAVPKHFWHRLHEKLVNEVFDAGEYFQILEEVSESGGHSYSVMATKQIKANDPNNIFLIDHAWTFRPQHARKQLLETPGLLDRICAVFNIEERAGSVAESHSDYGGSGDEGLPAERNADMIKAMRHSRIFGQSGAKSDIDESEVQPDRDRKKDAGHEEAKEAPNVGIGDTQQAGPSNTQNECDSLPESVAASPFWGSTTQLSDEERRINEVLNEMWRYIHTYTMRFAGKEPEECDMPLWYMPDEFGVRVGHSHEPNCRIVPIFHTPENMAYDLIFPTRDIEVDELVTRDFVDTLILKHRPDWRSVLMHPWIPIDLTDEKLEHVIASNEHFTRGRVPDILPSDAPDYVPGIANTKKVRVFADTYQLFDNLKSVEIEKVDRMEDAGVIWLRKHFNDYKSLHERNPKALINQFPYECVLTVKDLLAASIQSVHRDAVMDPKNMRWPPIWYETTFNLETELPEFVAYFQQRELKKMENTWIVKPWNLARGLDMHVTNNLSYIIRLVESGPKIACKYIYQPVLMRRPDNGNMVKFDLRYIVFLRSLRPLKLYLYKKFWSRFAVNEFSLSELDNRETHFTVFNYADEKKVYDMECEEFIKQFEQLYPIKWENVQSRINSVIKEVIETISKEQPPRGLAPNGQSRAMYGMDIMLKWDSDDSSKRNLCVSFIEGNFMPDCDRACRYYDSFADTAFRTMFMDEFDQGRLYELA